MNRYRTIVADPPWPYPGTTGSGWSNWKGDRKRLPYPSLTVDEIGSLDVAGLAEPDSHLYLWTTQRYITEAHEVARRWGFVPSEIVVWVKVPRGIGLGGAFTSTAEFVLFAKRGKLSPLQRLDRSWFQWKRPHNRHSAKPEAFLDLVETVSPGPYLELFARRNRLGWDTWGDEVFRHVELAT